jgi:hypothetical protein
MVGHSMVYGISGSTFSDMHALWNAGFVDFHVAFEHSCPGADSGFVSACSGLGASPIMNNGNDGASNCSGSYYASLASAGYMAAGGESEQASEDTSIMDNIIFMNYGGEFDCCNQLSDIYAHGMPSSTGKGTASYLETYVGVCGTYLCDANIIAASCKSAWDHGCREVGIMIGGWGAGHGWGAQSYLNMISTIERVTGKQCSGVVLWWGVGTDGNSTYSTNKSIMDAIMAVYPPNKTNIKKRFTGVGPGPTVCPPGQELVNGVCVQIPVVVHAGIVNLSATVRIQEYQPGVR